MIENRGGNAAPLPPCTAILTCPVCGESLQRAERALRCPRNHHFDFAREGYVNLLPAGHGRSPIGGDTADMIRARQRFLARGHYAPLVDRVQILAQQHLLSVARENRTQAPTVLEVGSGSGYYIGELARGVHGAPLPRPVCFFGLDVSKNATRLAARAYREVLFFVNDVRHRISLADASVDVIVDIFAPRNAGEFARVVRPGGLLLVVIPTPRHLHQLRNQLPLLDVEAGKRDRAAAALVESFDLSGEERLELEIELDGVEIVDALRMMPSAWHLEEEDLARAARMPRQRVTAGFEILQFRRQRS